MVTVQIELDERLAAQVNAIAEQQQKPVEQVLKEAMEDYFARVADDAPNPRYHQLLPEDETRYEGVIGVVKSDIADMSTTVRDTMERYYQERYGRSDG